MALKRIEQRGADALGLHGRDDSEILDVEGHAAVTDQPDHADRLGGDFGFGFRVGVGSEGGGRVGERDAHLLDAGRVPADGSVQRQEQFGGQRVLLDRQSHFSPFVNGRT